MQEPELKDGLTVMENIEVYFFTDAVHEVGLRTSSGVEYFYFEVLEQIYVNFQSLPHCFFSLQFAVKDVS